MLVLLSLEIGYVYLVFELEKSVRALLQACSHDPLSPDGLSEYYFKMSSRRMRCKEVSRLDVLSGLGEAWEAVDFMGQATTRTVGELSSRATVRTTKYSVTVEKQPTSRPYWLAYVCACLWQSDYVPALSSSQHLCPKHLVLEMK